ncbi:MAG: response regulator [Ottowia sp.]|nr:response regulator [Ottowia sp.]
MMKTNGEYCSTREAAALLGVSLRTAQLWVENGVLLAWKTAGGHRRILRQSVTRILEERKRALREPVRRGHRTMRIVLVEDDLDLLKLLSITIDELDLGIEVLTAQNGFEGLVLIGQAKPDLVIADLNVPGMDGFRMIRSLHGSAEFSPRRIIVSTALSRADIQDRGGLPDNITVLQKPMPVSELEALIRAEQALYVQPAHATN